MAPAPTLLEPVFFSRGETLAELYNKCKLGGGNAVTKTIPGCTLK